MLTQIASVALVVGRDLFPEAELADVDVRDEDGVADVCPRERLAFLQAVWPRVQSALAAIEAAPVGELRPDTRDVPLERARRVAPADLLRAIRTNAARGNLAPAPPTSVLGSRLRGYLPRRVREKTVFLTYDTSVNRSIKAILRTFTRDLADIADLATVGNVPEVAREAHRLRVRVRTALCREPWHNLVPAPVVGVLPLSLRTQGAYRVLFETWRRYRRGFGMDWSNPLFSLPARETWILYEYWCLFSLVHTLRELGYRAKTESGFGFAINRSGLTFTLVRGRGATLRLSGPNGTATVAYNRNFARQKAGKGGWYSRSHAMRPDITVEFGNHMLVFDAKYKPYTQTEVNLAEGSNADEEPANLPFVQDLNQMHAYRDGIRGEEAHRVQAAWLLYVGQNGPNMPVVAYPQASPEMPFGNGEVGAVLLRPGRSQAVLGALLRSLLTG